MASRKNFFVTILALCIAAAGSAAAQVEVPFQQDGRNKLIFLDARINGKPALLMLDSGASITAVNAALLEVGDWDLRIAKFSTQGPGVSGEAAWAKAELAIGSTKGTGRWVAAMKLEALTSRLGRHIDGILGQDFLSDFDHVVIDFKAKKLLLYR